MSVSCDLRIEQRLDIAGKDLFISNHLPFGTKMRKLKTNCK